VTTGSGALLILGAKVVLSMRKASDCTSIIVVPEDQLEEIEVFELDTVNP
jgi:hypothetical protein